MDSIRKEITVKINPQIGVLLFQMVENNLEGFFKYLEDNHCPLIELGKEEVRYTVSLLKQTCYERTANDHE